MSDAAPPGAPCQRIVERLNGTAGNAKYIFDADLFQIGHQHVGQIMSSCGIIFCAAADYFRMAID
jgi:hypothetical protein